MNASARTTSSSCDRCGWQSTLTSPRMAASFLARHPCEKRLAAAARSAAAKQRADAIDRTPQPCPHGGKHVHGDRYTYIADRCRCWPCAKANSANERRRTRQIAYGRWEPYVDADAGRRHVQQLRAAGMGLKEISTRSGVPHGGLSRLLYGTQTRQPSRRIRRYTEQRLLAVPVPDPFDLAAGARVPAVGARRRLQALVWVGWSVQGLADRYGIGRQALDGALTRRDTILLSTHRVIVRAYDDLWNVEPPQDTRPRRTAVAAARNRARAAGWAPPAAWDDDTIDDPAARPDGPATPDTRRSDRHAETRDAVADLTAAGLSARDIADRLGITTRTVVRIRADIRDEAA